MVLVHGAESLNVARYANQGRLYYNEAAQLDLVGIESAYRHARYSLTRVHLAYRHALVRKNLSDGCSRISKYQLDTVNI
jgi:hypothetical protein